MDGANEASTTYERPRTAMTVAERSRNYRRRKKERERAQSTVASLDRIRLGSDKAPLVPGVEMAVTPDVAQPTAVFAPRLPFNIGPPSARAVPVKGGGTDLAQVVTPSSTHAARFRGSIISVVTADVKDATSPATPLVTSHLTGATLVPSAVTGPLETSATGATIPVTPLVTPHSTRATLVPGVVTGPLETSVTGATIPVTPLVTPHSTRATLVPGAVTGPLETSVTDATIPVTPLVTPHSTRATLVPGAVTRPLKTSVTDATIPVTPLVTSHLTRTAPLLCGGAAEAIEGSVTIVTASSPRVSARRPISSYSLTVAALCLACVGVTMNGWFARSLGSTELAGWLFMGIGIAADLVALTAPATAAHLWQSRRWPTATAAWLVWLLTFMFAVTSGIGFASTNISDTILARGSRVTPAIASAEEALRDAKLSRDRECVGGVGKFCRQREADVADRTRTLNVALSTVEQASDPQAEAAAKILAWLSLGRFQPTANDISMLRLVLMALLPQVGGILLLVGRARPTDRTA